MTTHSRPQATSVRNRCLWLLTLLGLAAGVVWLLGGAVEPALAKPGGADLDVTFIERLPRYNFDDASKANPGWPNNGETITFKAHVKNNGSAAPSGWRYKWFIDGTVIYSSIYSGSLAPGTEIVFTISGWTWLQGNHKVKFAADTDGLIAEVSETNNQVEDQTNALTAGFWAEQGFYDWLNQHQYDLCVGQPCQGSDSFEDWAQRQIQQINSIYGTSTYPTATQGVLDRLRLDKVIVVPDGTLPLNCSPIDPPAPTNVPDCADKTVDFMWGFPTSLLTTPNPNYVYQSAVYDNGLYHELNHQRYIVDLYCWDVTQNQVQVRDASNNLVAGGPLMPFLYANVVYYNKEQGLMGGPLVPPLDEHSVRALNLSRITGRRSLSWEAKWGTSHPVGQLVHPRDAFGVYMNDIPASNTLQFYTAYGFPLANAQIRIFEARQGATCQQAQYLNTPDIQEPTDAQGLLNIGSFPFTSTSLGPNIINPQAGTGMFLVEITFGGKQYYEFREVTDFNHAYWNGNTQAATYPVRFGGKDSDGDGWVDSLEQYLGTDPYDACPDNLSDAAYPPDFNNNTQVRVDDILAVVNMFFKENQVPGWQRYDLTHDGLIRIDDVLLEQKFFFHDCTN